MTLNIWGFSKAQGRSIAGYVTTERSEIANPAGLPGGCERGEQQTRNAAKTSNIKENSTGSLSLSEQKLSLHVPLRKVG
jgi:hypothetical protein